MYKNHKKDVALVLLITFIMAGLQLAGPYFLGRMTDTIIHGGNKYRAITLALMALTFVAFNNVGSTARARFNLTRLWFPIQEYLRFKTIDGYLAFSIGQLKKTSTGLSREIMNDGEVAMMRLANIFIIQYMPMMARFIVISIILLWHYLPLGITVFCGLSIYAFCQIVMERKYTPRIKEMRDKNRASSNNRGEILIGATLIKSYSKELQTQERYRERYRESAETSKQTNFYINRWDNSIAFIVDATQTAALIAGILMIYDGKLTYGYLIMVQVWWIQMCSMIKQIGDQFQPILTDIADTRKFFELIDTPRAIREMDNPVHLTEIQGCIQFKHVSFGYPIDAKKKLGGSGKSVVKDVSFTVVPGENIAIVGPSGSGKTSLMTLLLRGYDPDAGAIEIDGNNLRTLALKDYYQHIAVVDQASLMMNMSIRDNILLGARKLLSDENILQLCRLVELDMDEFEDGLDTSVGEFGNSVSGGQKQRIAIARALASNAKILILDEPTSSLDAIAEAKIRRAIEAASKGRTTITIAHRLCTVQRADRIFLMENGEIKTVGTHRELLQKSGLYMQLVQEQMIEV